MERSIFYIFASFLTASVMQGVKSDYCERTWNIYGDLCYKFYDESIVQGETQKHCSSEGAWMLTVLTPRLKDFLVLHMGENTNSSYWCNTQAGDIDSSLLSIISTTLVSPAMTSPKPAVSTVKTGELCYYLQDKELHLGDCNVPRGFICEKDTIETPSKCPEGTDKIRSNCYWRTSDSMTREKAAEACSQQDGWLASLETRRKRTYAIATVALKRKNVWIGATKKEGKIKWDHGTDLYPDKEKTFIPIEDEGGDCVMIGMSDTSEYGTSWLFRRCSGTAYGLCEKNAEMVFPTNPPTTTNEMTTRAPECPGYGRDKAERDGICYWETTFETPRLEWETAREYCQSYGGDLASYKDAAEEELTLGNAKGYDGGLWMGLKRDPNSNVFRWSDGSSLTYTNWAPGQPTLRGIVKLCVAHTGKDSTWEVTFCGIPRYFVCKIPKVRIPHSPVPPTAAPVIECKIYSSSSLISWKYHQGYCYTFSYLWQFSYDTAKRFCQDNGAHLASLHSFDDVTFLLGLSFERSKKNSGWLGLRAKGLQASYVWDDGTPLDFVNWEADDPYDDISNIDTCVAFDISTGSFVKKHCNQLEYAICKAEDKTNYTFTTPSPTPIMAGYCPDGWYTFGNKCYRLFGVKDKSTWSEASRKCTEIGAELVSIHSQEEQDFLVLLEVIPKWGLWIGMYSTIGGRLFHWTDNSSLDYTNWEHNEPSYLNEQEECVHMVFYENEKKIGKWNDNTCSRRYSFVCQIPRDPMLTKPGLDAFYCANPKGWLKLDTSCYQIFNESDNRLTWLQAQSFCLSVQANLASIANFAVTIHLRRHLTGSEELFWVGIRDTVVNTYKFVGSPADLGYTNWLEGQPVSVSRLHNCVAVNAVGKWIVRNCDESHPFICEENIEPPTVAPPEPDLICPNTSKQWKEFGGKYCYIFEIKKEVTWYQAQHNCFSQGGQLASIHSEYEINAILHRIKYSKRTLHIGLAQKDDGSFGWFDGSAVDYVNWAPGEPNDYREQCAEMDPVIGTWNDINCDQRRGYICSTRKVPRNVSSTDTLTDKRNDVETRLNAGGVAGIVICVLVVLSIAAVAFYYLCPSTRMRSHRQTATTTI